MTTNKELLLARQHGKTGMAGHSGHLSGTPLHSQSPILAIVPRIDDAHFLDTLQTSRHDTSLLFDSI